MRRAFLGRLGLVPVVALAVAAGWSAAHATVEGSVTAQGRHVTIQDNRALDPRQGFDPAQGHWQYNPNNVEVARGEPVVFNSPRGNDHPHTVTNLQRTSPPTTLPVSFTAGNIFDSGIIEPGGSWTLQTASLAPGNYAYLCRLHPWMNGEVTVR
jgi:plastocyanin